jgi:hypothetical protein
MKKTIAVAFAACALFAVHGAQAGGINDNATSGGYWGADGHGYKDVIGSSLYDISGATIKRVASVLTITINTNFAGNAGSDIGIVGGKGIGYGDVFLAKAWNPFVASGEVADGHYSSDNAARGTNWDYGLHLDDRFDNQDDHVAGSFTLYNLTKGTNAQNILNSESFIGCANCTYRNGQAVAVNTLASNEYAFIAQRAKTNANVTGTWTVTKGSQIEFKMDLTGTDLFNFNSFAMHWGETCQNDVIEGAASVVSAPASMPLVGLGLGAMLLLRRRRAGRVALS